MNISTMTKDQLAAQLRDSTELLEKARMQINELAAQLEAERAKHAHDKSRRPEAAYPPMKIQ